MSERKEGLGEWNGAAKGGTQRKRRGIRIGVRRWRGERTRHGNDAKEAGRERAKEWGERQDGQGHGRALRRPDRYIQAIALPQLSH